MDGPYLSGEELILKARKPYTITKQRERWTEEEHNRFLEALKLYGRAWQRIEEHIGTKTAVQIRSHAQKFFAKLEKEANVKGIPVAQALDIEIPPPRPKRKPSIPYPRKLGNGHPMSQLGSRNGKSGNSVPSVPLTEDTLDLEREPLPERPSDENFESEIENQEDASCRSCVLPIHPGCLSSSVNKNSFAASGGKKPCAFKEFVPNLEEEVNSVEVNESFVTVEARDKLHLKKVDIKLSFQEKNSCDDTRLTIPPASKENRSQGILAEGDESKLKGNLQAPPSHPRPVPVHVVDASMEIDTPHVTPHMGYHESIMHPSGGAPPEPFMDHSSSVNLHMAYHKSVMHAPDGANLEPFVDHSSSANSEHRTSTSNITFNQSFPGLHPILTPTQNLDDYQSFIHASSTFSNLVMSTLLQNPAAHAAASFAASFWPCANMEVPDCNTGGFPVGSINAAPSLAAIAAATVASATAWWAAHGLLPLCRPFQMGLGYAPSTASPVPMARTRDDERRKEANDPSSEPQQIKPESSEALQGQHLTLKSPALASSALTVTETEQGGVDTELQDTNKPKGRKEVGSSCGSNTPSSSEVDTDGMEKQKENKEELGVDTIHHPAGDAIGRRARNSIYSSDSWKEVSEEGRMAFQALFSRVVLPQSFSATNDSNNEGKRITEKDQHNSYGIDDEASKFGLNGKIWFNCSPNQEVKENAYRRDESSSKEDGLLITGKLKGRRTGFKPYKRCSMEAKEGRGPCANISQNHEKCPKRLRLEGEALS